MKIKLRLSLLFAGAASLLIGVGGAVFVHDLWIGLENGVVAELQNRAQSIQQDLGSHSVVSPLVNRGTPTDIDEASQILVQRDGHLVDLVRSGARPLLSVTQWHAARRAGIQLTRAGLHPGDTLLVWALPSAADGGAVVAVASSTDTIDAATDRVEAGLLVGGPIMVVLAALAAWLVAAAALRPVERMRVQAARRSLAGLRAEPLDVSDSGDEISALGRTLNEMIAAAHTASDRQSAFVTAAGHELRTPLANLKLELELAGRPGRSHTDLVQSVTAAAEEVERLGRLAEGLLLLAGQDEGRPLVLVRPCDVADVAGESLDGFTTIASQRGVKLESNLPDRHWVLADSDRIRQVVDNLVDNALRFAPPDSTVEVVLTAQAGETVLAVSDRGPGFDQDFLPRAFDRFSVSSDSRTRTHGGGAGLGLAIVKSIVAAHGGTVEADNRAEGGGRVTARMPLAPAGRHRRPGKTKPSPPVKMAPAGR